ncbi:MULTISPECIES: alanine/ornithine racemase family PLP-dependent enzyme [unclassified Paludibacterium]|uniref:alanine/ornithine racemase family PLP-dependent enzyme n=1 Tax=unclassified Paludibacterium TaxID=2618429 RepID=UPI001C04CA13|nr:alanine/ornithine racemase family PLP-dependent enzyme [Paludibacterium sp. B53371]BEV73649.1 ornithine racemase Orr [Paludibacterium sp. THUN1379]
MSPHTSLPCLCVDLDKIRHNTRLMAQHCHEAGIQLAAVVKLMRGAPQVARALRESGVDLLADSRLSNLQRLADSGLPRLLLRLPSLHQVDEVVMHSEISLNSEAVTLQALSEAACRLRREHQVIVMQDLGDLREGCWDEEETLQLARLTCQLPGLRLAGIGANLACYGGVAPSVDNQQRLVRLAQHIRETLQCECPVVSGCNSAASFMLLDHTLPSGINQLRLGASLLMGIGLNDLPIPGLVQDAMRLQAEIIECRAKPSVPLNSTALDAFGHRPVFEDRGIRQRALCALGKQDVSFSEITPLDPGIRIIGGSSDHLILDVSDASHPYRVGDSVGFSLSYAGTLQCMTSDDIQKVYLH